MCLRLLELTETAILSSSFISACTGTNCKGQFTQNGYSSLWYSKCLIIKPPGSFLYLQRWLRYPKLQGGPEKLKMMAGRPCCWSIQD